VLWQGADDHLVKVWSAQTGRLLCTMRGHAAEITDIACSANNRLLAVGSCDKLIRIWCLQTAAPVAVLHGHSNMITSVRVSTALLSDHDAEHIGHRCLHLSFKAKD